MSLAIEIKNLTKDFSTDFWKPKVRSLEDVSFSVHEGGIFGLIGHNGAGKTTAIKILLGLLRPTLGSANIFGQSVINPSSRHDVGYLPESAYYYEFLKAGEILDFYARLFGIGAKERGKRVDELLELVGLKDRKEDTLKTFSKGMLQRIGIAQAIINDPKLVILDEPMSGLDPIGRKDVRDIILHLSEKKKTILFSSHILSDVEAICDEVAILVKGKLASSGALSELVRAKVKTVEVTFECKTKKGFKPSWKEKVSFREIGSRLLIIAEDLTLLPDILEWGKGEGHTLISVAPNKETLEDLYMETSKVNR